MRYTRHYTNIHGHGGIEMGELTKEQLQEANTWLRGRVSMLEELIEQTDPVSPNNWALKYHRLADDSDGYLCKYCLDLSDSTDDLDMSDESADLEHLPNCPIGRLQALDL